MCLFFQNSKQTPRKVGIEVCSLSKSCVPCLTTISLPSIETNVSCLQVLLCWQVLVFIFCLVCTRYSWKQSNAEVKTFMMRSFFHLDLPSFTNGVGDNFSKIDPTRASVTFGFAQRAWKGSRTIIHRETKHKNEHKKVVIFRV